MGIFKTNISLLNKFLKSFSCYFSKKQMAILSLLIYALFKDYKRNSLYTMAKVANTDYQRFQYFFSDSKWNLQAVKDRRLEIIENQLTTASTNDGIIAIDDTGCPKPFARHTEGAKWQYCAPLKREERCNVAVASAFVSQTKHFPISVIPYLPADEFDTGENDPRFKSKIEIAKALFEDALEKGIKFSAVVFDSWYASSELIEYIDNKDKTFFSELKSNRNIFMFHPGKKTHDFVKPDELVTLIKKHYWHKVRYIKYKTSYGNEVSKQVFSFKAQLKVRHTKKIERYWNLCLIAWTLTYWIKQNACLHKILETQPASRNEYEQAINSCSNYPQPANSQRTKNLLMTISKLNPNTSRKNWLLNF